LVLLNLKLGRFSSANQSLREFFKCSIVGAELLQVIAKEFKLAGRFENSTLLLQRALQYYSKM